MVPPTWTLETTPADGDRFRRLCVPVQADSKQKRGLSDDGVVFYLPELWFETFDLIISESEGLGVTHEDEGRFLWQLLTCKEETWNAAEARVRKAAELPTTTRRTNFRALAEFFRKADLVPEVNFDPDMLIVLRHATTLKRT